MLEYSGKQNQQQLTVGRTPGVLASWVLEFWDMSREASLVSGKVVNLVWDMSILKGLRNICVLLSVTLAESWIMNLMRSGYRQSYRNHQPRNYT